jgi:hypothetical protein
MGLFCLRTLIATARQQEEAEEEEGILKKKKEQFAPRVLKKSQLAQLLRFGMKAQTLIPAINMLLGSG